MSTMPDWFVVELTWQSGWRLIVWTLLIWALSRAIFRSFVAREVFGRLLRRGQQRAEGMRVLRWEVDHGRYWDPAAARGAPGAAARPLEPEVAAQKRQLLDRAVRASLGWRALRWMSECGFCHASWVALTLLCVSAQVSWNGLAGVFIYAGLADRLRATFEGRSNGVSNRGSCPDCGR